MSRLINELLDRAKRVQSVAEPAKPAAGGVSGFRRGVDREDLPEIGDLDQIPLQQKPYGPAIGLEAEAPALSSPSWNEGGGSIELDSGPRKKSGSQRLPLSPPASPLKGGADASFDMEPVFRPIEEVTGAPSARKVQIPASEEEALPAAISALPPLEKIRSAELIPPPGGSSASPLPEPSDDVFITSLPGSPPTNSAPQEEEDEDSFRQVFKDFLAIKRQCGESTSTQTFERFAEKLKSNRDSLVKRYGCKEVRFQVYIKDGKAALKATPIKD